LWFVSVIKIYIIQLIRVWYFYNTLKIFYLPSKLYLTYKINYDLKGYESEEI